MKARKKIIRVAFIAILGIALAFFITKKSATKSPTLSQNENQPNLISDNLTQTSMIISSVFQNNEYIPVQYTCDGKNVNPPIIVSDAPTDAKSFALIVDDPDAPLKTFVHWTVWNIPPDTKEIRENAMPQNAVQGKTDFGSNKWGGPCPPRGTHRYFFKLYALDTLLDLNSSSSKSDLEQAMQGRIIDKTTLVGLYQRR